jgi:hypothetical protein
MVDFSTCLAPIRASARLDVIEMEKDIISVTMEVNDTFIFFLDFARRMN